MLYIHLPYHDILNNMARKPLLVLIALRLKWQHIAALLIILSIGNSYAQFSVGVAPPRFSLNLSAGSNHTEEFVIFSREDFSQDIKPDVRDWTLNLLGEVVVLEPSSQLYSASEWIDFINTPFILGSQTDKTLEVNIAVPDNIPDGSYWSTLTLTTEPKQEDHQGMSIQQIGRLAVIIYVHVGQLLPSGELVDFYFEEGEDGEIEIVALIQNTGNSVLRFAGTISFLDTSGEPANTIELDERVVLREGLAEFRMPFPEDLPEDTLLMNVLFSDESSGINLYGEIELP